MLEEILDHLVSEKMDCKEYKEIAEKMEDEELKKMFNFMSEQEHDHYKMIKEYLARHMRE